MRKIPASLAHALAAEYVLGTLRGRARERFAGIARADPQVMGIVHRWEAGLCPLGEHIEPVEPPARVWGRIAERTGHAPTAITFRTSLGFWRSLGLLAGGVASVLLAAFLYISGSPRGDPMFVAVLTAPDTVPHTVVSMPSPGMLRVRMVTRGKCLKTNRSRWPSCRCTSLRMVCAWPQCEHSKSPYSTSVTGAVAGPWM